MPTDPNDPSSPTPSTPLYQTTSEAPKGGGGGVFVVILLLLLLGGAAAYYFLVYKPGAVAAAALPSPTPVATRAPAAAAATPKVDPNKLRAQYVKQAEQAYSAVADAKRGAFSDAFKAFLASGGFSAAGLTSKEAIAARRDLLAKCQAANTDYEEFIKVQEPTYKAELQKTPLAADDVTNVFDDYKFKAQTEKSIQLRDLERESFNTGDELLGYLDKTYGNWSVNAGRLTFKPGVSAPFNAISKKYGEQADALNKLQAEIKAGMDSTGAAPGTSPAAPGAAASPVAASPAAVASPASSPAVAPAPGATP